MASYVPAVGYGRTVYTSGQLPLHDGKLLAEGKVGSDVSTEQAYRCAKQCALNAQLQPNLLGGLDMIKGVGMVTVCK